MNIKRSPKILPLVVLISLLNNNSYAQYNLQYNHGLLFHNQKFSLNTNSGNNLSIEKNFWGQTKLNTNFNSNKLSYKNNFLGSNLNAQDQFGNNLIIKRPFHKLTFINLSNLGKTSNQSNKP